MYSDENTFHILFLTTDRDLDNVRNVLYCLVILFVKIQISRIFNIRNWPLKV